MFKEVAIFFLRLIILTFEVSSNIGYLVACELLDGRQILCELRTKYADRPAAVSTALGET